MEGAVQGKGLWKGLWKEGGPWTGLWKGRGCGSSKGLWKEGGPWALWKGGPSALPRTQPAGVQVAAVEPACTKADGSKPPTLLAIVLATLAAPLAAALAAALAATSGPGEPIAARWAASRSLRILARIASRSASASARFCSRAASFSRWLSATPPSPLSAFPAEGLFIVALS